MGEIHVNFDGIEKKKYHYDNYVKAALQPADKRELERISEATGASVSSMVADAVSEYLRNMRPSKNSY